MTIPRTNCLTLKTPMARLCLTICVFAFMSAAARADMVFFERNATLDPVPNAFFATNLEETGFSFTPTSNVDLSGFRTRFGAADGRTLSVQLFQSVMGVPNTASTLLNESFTAVDGSGGQFSQATFNPITLVGGLEYFVAISNITGSGGLGGLGVNFTSDAGATSVPRGEVRFTSAGDPLRFTNSLTTAPEIQQIVQLIATPASVPEPSTTILLGLCGVVGGGLSWRRRRRASCTGSV